MTELCPETDQQLRKGKAFIRKCGLPLGHAGKHGKPSSHHQWLTFPLNGLGADWEEQLFDLGLAKFDDAVYFMLCWNKTAIKIGHSRDVENARKAIQRGGGTTLLLGCIPGSVPLEQWFHEKFKHLSYDSKHELFKLGPDLIECINVLFGVKLESM